MQRSEAFARFKVVVVRRVCKKEIQIKTFDKVYPESVPLLPFLPALCTSKYRSYVQKQVKGVGTFNAYFLQFIYRKSGACFN